MERSEVGWGNDSLSPTDHVPGRVHRVDQPRRQAEPDGKRRRTGPGPQGQRNSDRGSEMAILVMEPESQGTSAEPEDSSDIHPTMSARLSVGSISMNEMNIMNLSIYFLSFVYLVGYRYRIDFFCYCEFWIKMEYFMIFS